MKHSEAFLPLLACLLTSICPAQTDPTILEDFAPLLFRD
jgi:hypothetical protein